MISMEQKMRLQHSLLSGCQMVLDKIEKKSSAGIEMPMYDTKCMVEIMAMVADICKDIAKTNYYEREAPSSTL